MNSNNPTSPAAGWDTYWNGTGAVDACLAGGASHPALRKFWDEFFEHWGTRYPNPSYVDVATGNGAVLESALRALGDRAADVTCIDIAPTAIDNVIERFPNVKGIVADAAAMPLDDATCDIVTSQFGIEYAGPEAVFEAARLVAPGGCLALLMHIDNGIVHRECADSLTAIERLRASSFIPLATELFRRGFAAVRGADRTPYDDAGRKLAPAVEELEKTLDEYGDAVAGGTLSTLYDDVARIHSRMPHYEPDDVLGWLATMNDEVDAYAGRMESMLSTAADASAFERIRAHLERDNFKIDQAGQFVVSDSNLPLAWILIATRAD
ncbi:MAG: class I SAM-dependent methyltransferase [Woeseiaceae bacterium]|nr:class I SAM-dependent methyltransferase [Woeseiaceae bacterium]